MPSLKIRIYFTERDKGIIARMVAERVALALRGRAFGKRKIDTRKQELIELDGARAECAVARYFRLPLLPRRSLGDNGVDFLIGEYTADVKGTRWQDGHLVFVDEKRFRADRAILVETFSEDYADICGWITREEFLQKKYFPSFLKSKSPAVHQTSLNDMRDWDGSLTKRREADAREFAERQRRVQAQTGLRL